MPSPPSAGRATKPGPALAIVADDLTGAADAAAPFAGRCAGVAVALQRRPPDGIEVLALVTDSRWRSTPAATHRVSESVRTAQHWGAQRLFVKVDSTLRGDVLGQVTAALRAWGAAPALAAPAFPAQGRVARGGVLHVHGQPLPGTIAAHFPAGVEVVDAQTDEDLLHIARQVMQAGAVAVGSAGLARALAAVLYPLAAPHPLAAPPHPRRRAVLGVVVVVGTAHPASRAQAAALSRHRSTLSVVVRPSTPVDAAPIAAALARGALVLVTVEVAEMVEDDSPRAHALATELASVVGAIATASPDCGLILTGGATALAVAESLGAHALKLLRELSPGIAVGELLLADRGIPTITKSGGFGTDDALVRAVEYLKECS